MKTIYLIRHAKSSWENPGLRDKDRPLNSRGRRDAPFMAKLLRGQGVNPDQLISSPANRALTTATFFAEAFGKRADDIIIMDRIYEAYSEDILQIIRQLSDEWHTVLLFGHNPTFTDVANYFTRRLIANIPTCGIVQLNADIDRWAAFSPDTAEVANFMYPKQYLD